MSLPNKILLYCNHPVLCKIKLYVASHIAAILVVILTIFIYIHIIIIIFKLVINKFQVKGTGYRELRYKYERK